MIKFSANLGFLWKKLSLPDAIRAAKTTGFDAVECHMPYKYVPTVVSSALEETGLPMISLNTRIGENDNDIGVAALPGREAEARTYIKEAIAYAVAIGCPNVSVVAGRSGRTPAAEVVYRENLRFATGLAQEHNKTILIEPLNTNVAADYHLTKVEQGLTTIHAVGMDNLKIMLDCFHTQTMEGNLLNMFQQFLPYIGHIQISAFPDRGEPDIGDIDYQSLLPEVVSMGYDGYFGAEYTPRGSLVDGLRWLESWRDDK